MKIYLRFMITHLIACYRQLTECRSVLWKITSLAWYYSLLLHNTGKCHVGHSGRLSAFLQSVRWEDWCLCFVYCALDMKQVPVMCLYASTRSHTYTESLWGMYEGLGGLTCHLSVCHCSWWALSLNLPAWGHDKGQSRSDRHWQGSDPCCTLRAGGCLSMCHPEWQSGVLCLRWKDAATR